MTDKIASFLRHAITGAVGLGGYLVTKGFISAVDAPAVDSAIAAILSALATVVAAILARQVLSWFPKIEGSKPEDDEPRTPPSSTLSLLLLIGTVAGICVALPSCTSGSPFDLNDYVGGSYSAKAGISLHASIHSDSGK